MPAQGPTPPHSSIRSPIYWALLGILIKRPTYGYAVLKRFEREYGSLLPLSGDGHIYTALNVLEDKGLIERVPGESGAKRQPKPSYRVTPEGERGFFDWVATRTCHDRLQWQVFVRQLVATALRKPGVALQILDCCEHAYLAEADDASRVASFGDRSCEEDDGLATRLIADERRLTIGGRLDWINNARKDIQAERASGTAR